ncbi:sigma factor [Conexibacter sp. S30A1]|uniref:sigma factor n=1 Tax=Conexibacter sp. S30A1 TaxID=2937800 RepID=UPI002010241B|nr:sigma factor [Conexibacter sp. S30A1]
MSRPEGIPVRKGGEEVNGYCYRMLGSPFDAEDAVQDTLIRAWRAHARFEDRSA